MLNQVAIWFQEKSEIELQYQDPKRSTACRHSKIDQEFYAESHENVSVAGAIREWSSHFVYSFTLHGLQHAFTETLWIHRVLWTVLLLQAMSCFSFQTFMLLKKYFNYPVTTKVSSKHEAITDFPSVTIRKSVAKVNGSDQLFFTSILSQ